MSSADGPEGPRIEPQDTDRAEAQSVESQLFESLILQLIEKGVLTKNDGLSVVQTVAEVKRGKLEAGGPQTATVRSDLAMLERLYSSLELVRDRPGKSQANEVDNVRQLRPPIHRDSPKFPKGD